MDERSMNPSVITTVDLQEERVTAALQAVLQSETFQRTKRLRELLQYLVSETLAGRGDRLKQFTIAVDAFGRDGGFDPRVDTSVRTEAWRLRTRLELYYRTEGVMDLVRISLPKGGFTPRFQFMPKSIGEAVALPAVREQPRPRLLVLPFSGLSIDEPDLVTSFHEEISLYLANLPSVAVLSQGSSQKFGQAAMDLRLVSRASQASYVMEGSLFRQGRTYRLNLRIIDPILDVTVWSGRHEQQVDDMIVFQRKVATEVASSVHGWLCSRATTLIGEDEMAPRYVLRDDMLLREYLRGAIRDRTAGEQVVLGLGRLTSGYADEATTMFNQAIMASPADGLPHTAMGLGYLQAGRLEEAYQAAGRGVELAPRSAFAVSSLAAICMHMRDFDGAIMFAQRSVALAPEFDAVKLMLGDCFLYAGLANTAIAQLEETCRLMDEHPIALGHLGYAYAQTGQETKARRILNVLQDSGDNPEGPNSAAMTMIHVGLQEVEQAFHWLDQALTSRAHTQELLLLTSPAYDILRSHPHFNSFAGRLNAS
jgi:TolB-like protein/Flp pilus assembly protein TadD